MNLKYININNGDIGDQLYVITEGFINLFYFLYLQIEIAERQAAALQDAPPECRPEHLAWYQKLQGMFSIHQDKCAKYHEKLLIDPLWEVPPTKVSIEYIIFMIMIYVVNILINSK